MMTTARTTLLETILVRMLTLMKVLGKDKQQQRHQILVKIVKQNLVVIKVVMKIPYIRLKRPQ